MSKHSYTELLVLQERMPLKLESGFVLQDRLAKPDAQMIDWTVRGLCVYR